MQQQQQQMQMQHQVRMQQQQHHMGNQNMNTGHMGGYGQVKIITHQKTITLTMLNEIFR